MFANLANSADTRKFHAANILLVVSYVKVRLLGNVRNGQNGAIP